MEFKEYLRQGRTGKLDSVRVSEGSRKMKRDPKAVASLPFEEAAEELDRLSKECAEIDLQLSDFGGRVKREHGKWKKTYDHLDPSEIEKGWAAQEAELHNWRKRARRARLEKQKRIGVLKKHMRASATRDSIPPEVLVANATGDEIQEWLSTGSGSNKKLMMLMIMELKAIRDLLERAID